MFWTESITDSASHVSESAFQSEEAPPWRRQGLRAVPQRTSSIRRRCWRIPATPRRKSTPVANSLGDRGFCRRRGSSGKRVVGGWCASRRWLFERRRRSNWRRGKAIGLIRSPWWSSTSFGTSRSLLWRQPFWFWAEVKHRACLWGCGLQVMLCNASFTWCVFASSIGGGDGTNAPQRPRMQLQGQIGLAPAVGIWVLVLLLVRASMCHWRNSMRRVLGRWIPSPLFVYWVCLIQSFIW